MVGGSIWVGREMTVAKFVEAYSLNVAANPHPPGVYIRALDRASAILVKVRGSDSAKITKPKKDERNENFYIGRILVWTEIDWKGRWLDLEKEDALPPDVKDKVVIETAAKPNYRVFNYAFDNANHIMYFESRNEYNQNFGASTGRRLFSKLFSPDILGQDSPEILTTLIPEDAAIEQILSMPGLRKLTIRITRQNADVTGTGPRRRIFEELEAAKAKKVEIVYTKQAGAEKLESTPEIQEELDAARVDGLVTGQGRGDISGKRELSTNDLPKKLTLDLDNGDSFLARLLSSLRPRQERSSGS